MWPILKDAEKWIDNGAIHVPKPRWRNDSSEGSQSGSRTSKSFAIPSVCVDLNADEDEEEYINDEVGTINRPTGTKAAKIRRKVIDEKKKIADKIMEDNQAIKELLEKSLQDRTSFASKFE